LANEFNNVLFRQKYLKLGFHRDSGVINKGTLGEPGGVALHWIVAACAGVLLVAACQLEGLPLRLNWPLLMRAFWGGMTVGAIFAATVFYLIGFPLSQTVRPVWIHYKQQKLRIPVFVVFATWMLLHFGVSLGGVIVFDGLVLAELMDRSRGSLDTIATVLRSVAGPAVYLFFGLVAVFCYNDLIASMKFIGAYDAFFLKLDSFLMNGLSISGLAHSLATRLPVQVFEMAEFIYFGMFGQVSAGLVLTALCLGRRESFRYVGTILTAYAISIALFYLWPTIGPFYTCPSHSHPHFRLASYDYQQYALQRAHLLAASSKWFNTINADYFIAFPCMHIAQPLIVMWFLRRWKRITYALIVYDIMLVPAILLLEWHYLVDVIAGIMVAAAAIGIASVRFTFGPQRKGIGPS
jgi:PAP2 superfamily protein